VTVAEGAGYGEWYLAAPRFPTQMPHFTRSLGSPLFALMLLFGSACSASTAPREEELTLEVAATRVACVGVVPMECLQVRMGGQEPWQLFYDAIEGFTWEPGYRYTLRVARRVVSDPPADGSSVAYRLLEVLARVAE
jgi:hypothetical protein